MSRQAGGPDDQSSAGTNPEPQSRYDWSVASGTLTSPSVARNRDPILSLLRRFLPQIGTVLEIASGTGEHGVHFAAAFPRLQWQPTDYDEQSVSRKPSGPPTRGPLVNKGMFFSSWLHPVRSWSLRESRRGSTLGLASATGGSLAILHASALTDTFVAENRFYTVEIITANFAYHAVWNFRSGADCRFPWPRACQLLRAPVWRTDLSDRPAAGRLARHPAPRYDRHLHQSASALFRARQRAGHPIWRWCRASGLHLDRNQDCQREAGMAILEPAGRDAAAAP